MIWIASYPRSGNTFFRNILYEVYGLESSTFHIDPGYPLDKDYDSYPFVKTHLLPEQLRPAGMDIPAVCIIRDGRDALCSMAHHRKDIIAPGSDYYENLKAAIIADKGSFFGGWSVNVAAWLERADIVIRYEDLLIDPIKCAERLRQISEMPEPQKDKLPSFRQLKFGIPQYGSGKNRNLSEEEMKSLAERNFRRGKAGSWKEEMPEELQDLFWCLHGDMMERLGYTLEGEIAEPDPELDHLLIRKLGNKPGPGKGYRILIEADKIATADNDGVKRYQAGLLKALWPVTENPGSEWKIDLYIKGEVMPLSSARELVFSDFANGDLKKEEETVRVRKSLFQRFEEKLVDMVPDNWVKYLDRKNIRIFHQTYDGIKKAGFFLAEATVKTAGLASAMTYQAKEKTLESLGGRSKRMFEKYDMVHLPLMQHYRPFKNTRRALLVTVHDLTHRYYPQFHTAINITNAEKGLKFARKRNADLLAVSGSTRDDCVKEAGIPPERIHMVYEAVDRAKFRYQSNHTDNTKVKEKYGIEISVPYFLCLSTIEPRKNLANTIQAFTLLLEEVPDQAVRLVIAGKKGWATDKLFLHNKLLTERIHFTGFIDDEDLSALYSEAVALCYVSYYEGFGLPPLEAMRCMTPVIYGRNSSMPEVIGEGGLAADPDDIVEIKDQMKHLLTDSAMRERLGRRALRRSLQFSWRKAALETMEVYRYICSRNEELK